FPLAGCLVNAFGWRVLPGKTAGWIGAVAIGLAFVCAIVALIALQDHTASDRTFTSSLWTYAAAAGLDIKLGIYVDPLSVFMILVVSGVSTLIHLYSVAYLESDRGYARYFSYLNFFVFSMLLLVLAGNFVLLIVGWAFVGFASYALISFINVIGDVGLVLATFFIFRDLGTFDYGAVFSAAQQQFHTNQGVVIAICLLLLVGAFAKSAQLPLHTWLPDAMEGPTPVSALIHAATMVTAGVYLIARTHVLFELAPTAADISAFIGLGTLIFAATCALAVTDLKRIIAYSTISQIGYMVVGVSIGAYGAGLFHLMTHAFFKALLFMAAGSVISAMAGTQNIDRMGGLRRALPFTSVLMIVGALALAAFPLTSGFFSKDEILVFASTRGGMYWIFTIGGYVGALLTGFYAFRIIFRVFWGEPVPEARELEQGHLAHAPPENPLTGEEEDTDIGFPGAEHHIAERDWEMGWAMAILGFLALFGGFVQIPGVDNVVENFLAPSFANSVFANIIPSTGSAYLGLLVGAIISIVGVSAAYWVYVLRPGTSAALIRRVGPVHTFLVNKWYFDELYDAVVYRPLIATGWFANNVFERVVVQGIVTAAVDLVRGVGVMVRGAQSGFVRAYALLLIGGFAALGLYFLIASQ
ncbi:MAG: NADH-quinone oxidoreductase subunit L, partial [Actinobacteria bacterium]